MSPRSSNPDANIAYRIRQPRPHVVYRIFDAADQLLYIGVAEDIEYRIYLHLAPSTTSGCSPEIRERYARHAVEEYPTLTAAHAAEIRAIHDEAPLLNKQHNPKRWRRVKGRWCAVPAADDQAAA